MPKLNEIEGNIWDYYNEGFFIVVTTNLGWKKNGHNVMGAGIAKQAANKFRWLPKNYGKFCKTHGHRGAIYVFTRARLIMFPTKPLIWKTPWLSWNQDSDLELIDQSCKQLRKFLLATKKQIKVAMPYPGCGNGGLDRGEVRPILERHLSDLPKTIELLIVSLES